jgi:hypothetical protein
MANDDTLLSMIPALQKETVGGPGAANTGHRSCAPLGVSPSPFVPLSKRTGPI